MFVRISNLQLSQKSLCLIFHIGGSTENNSAKCVGSIEQVASIAVVVSCQSNPEIQSSVLN